MMTDTVNVVWYGTVRYTVGAPTTRRAGSWTTGLDHDKEQGKANNFHLHSHATPKKKKVSPYELKPPLKTARVPYDEHFYGSIRACTTSAVSMLSI